MAEKVIRDELDQIALQLFAQRVATQPPHQRHQHREAEHAYQMAQVFVETARRVHAGEVRPADATRAKKGPQLADCWAGNLGRYHPVNMVAVKWVDKRSGKTFDGDPTFKLVHQILDYFRQRPLPDYDASRPDRQDDWLHEFNREFEILGGWDLPTLNVARATFAAYASAA